MALSLTIAWRQEWVMRSSAFAIVISITLAFAAGVLSNGFEWSDQGGREPSLRWGVLLGKLVVTCSTEPDGPRRPEQAIDTSVSVIQGGDERQHDVPFETSRADFLDGHPMRLQAGFERIWQIQPQSKDFLPHSAGGGAGDWVDSTPGAKVQSAAGPRGMPPQDIVWQLLGGPAVGDHIGPMMPRLLESIRRLTNNPNLRPLLYYDFAVSDLRFRPAGVRMESVVEGILFVHHRYEPERFLVAVQFPVNRNEQRWEKIVVPFSEPFFCAVDSEGTNYFVTDSGRLYAASKPAAGKPREAKPLFGETAWRGKVLLRDAKTGAAFVFVQTQATGPSDRDVLVQLGPQVNRRQLPAGFLAGLEGKPASVVLWKCSELLQNK
jgi:hypothetical protein